MKDSSPKSSCPPCHQCSLPAVVALIFLWNSSKWFETHILKENPKVNRNSQNCFPLINIHTFRAKLLHCM